MQLWYCLCTVCPRCRKLPKALKEWQAFNDLKKRIDDFNEACPLLEMMANPAMKERHWQRLEALTKHSFDVESESFYLRNIMEAPLLENKEDIEVKSECYMPVCSWHVCRQSLVHCSPLNIASFFILHKDAFASVHTYIHTYV